MSGSEESVFPFAFKDNMPLVSCLECLSREYRFLVLTFGGVSRSSVSRFKPSISPTYFSYALSDHEVLGACRQGLFFWSVGLPDLVQRL